MTDAILVGAIPLPGGRQLQISTTADARIRLATWASQEAGVYDLDEATSERLRGMLSTAEDHIFMERAGS